VERLEAVRMVLLKRVARLLAASLAMGNLNNFGNMGTGSDLSMLGGIASLNPLGGVPNLANLPPIDTLGGMGAVGSTALNVDPSNPADLSQQINAMAAAMMMGNPANGTGASAGTDLGLLASLQGIDLSGLAGLDPTQTSALLSLYGLQGTPPEPPTADSMADKRRNKFTGRPPGEGKRGDWICAYCQQLNYCMQKNCHECGAENVGATRVGMKAGDWVCPGCGDLVFSNKHVCRMCNTKRPLDSLKSGEWICSKCDYIVFSYKTVCSKCNTPRPSGQVKVYEELKRDRPY